MVREDDVAVNDENLKSTRSKKVSDLHNRLALADKNPQALFISIHQNKFPQAQSWGTQVFYSKNNPRSEQLAQCIQNNVHTILQPTMTARSSPRKEPLHTVQH
jgi:N-acetylmuramoyl-L-alanine amidase